MTTLDSHPTPRHHQGNRTLVAMRAMALLGLIAAGTLLAQMGGYRVPLWFCLLPVLLLLVLLWWGFNSPSSRRGFLPRTAATGSRPSSSKEVMESWVRRTGR